MGKFFVFEGESGRTKQMKKAPHDKNSYRKLLNLQNAWDDEDENNVSHERIDVYSKMQENQEVFFRRCQ